MQKFTRLGLLFSLFAIVAFYSPATPQCSAQSIVQYAAKFVCGKSDGKLAAPGQYFTIINVHNPSAKQVKFRKRFALGRPGENVGDVTDVIFPPPLKPDHVMGIDCPDIYEHTKTPDGEFIEGYVVLYSPVELDVVSVFTAGDDRVATLHTERVPFRRSAFPPCSDVDLSINTGFTQWRVVIDPIGNTTEPRAASLMPVIFPSPNGPPFPPLAGAAWVGPIPNAGSVPVNSGLYIYDLTFCLCQGFSNAKLKLEGLSIDPATVTLNGLTLGTIPNSNAVTNLSASTGWIVGTNTLRVIVNKRAKGVTGINIRGSITATAGACPGN